MQQDQATQPRELKNVFAILKRWLLIAPMVVVLAVGYLVWQLRSSEVGLPLSGVATKPSDWKTYQNDQHGFEFRYPSNLEEDVIDEYIYFGSPDGKGVHIQLNFISETLNQDEITTVYGVVGSGDIKEVTIGGRTAFYFTHGDAGCGGPEYRIPITDETHLAMQFIDCDESSPHIIDRVDVILSTFRFVEPENPEPTPEPQGSTPEPTLEASPEFTSTP